MNPYKLLLAVEGLVQFFVQRQGGRYITGIECTSLMLCVLMVNRVLSFLQSWCQEKGKIYDSTTLKFHALQTNIFFSYIEVGMDPRVEMYTAAAMLGRLSIKLSPLLLPPTTNY